MPDNMMHDASNHMPMMWVALLAAVVLVVAIVTFFARRAPEQQLLIADIAGNQPALWGKISGATSGSGAADTVTAHDTIFILPDISNYTSFMTGNRFASGHAQYVVFSLINAMIEAACRTVELSKLEGDAALFFVDSKKLTNTEVGQTVMDIFAAFFRERARLIKSNICPCSACSQIENLDLKIFVHRGRASRFEFRGSIDHFGTDVIILHRMMKNSVRGHRYVMVTDAAKSCIDLPGEFDTFKITEEHDHIGKVSARVFQISDAMALKFNQLDEGKSSWLSDLASKLRQNFMTATRFFKRS
jgi:hypothetical protein